MNNSLRKLFLLPFGLLASLSLSGCASIAETDPEDPFESYNRAIYAFNDGLDRAIVKPVAQGYNAVLPDPVNKGISNFFSNLDDVVVVFNDLLQFKLEQALTDTGRIVFNSTFGLLGFIDVSSSLQLPKHNEDFGQTLGYWGLDTGPYFVLPVLGPSTIRDTGGVIVDSFVDPLGEFETDDDRLALYVLKGIDTRAGLLSASKILEEAALDPYLFVRDAYLQRRQNLVYDGNPPPIKFEE